MKALLLDATLQAISQIKNPRYFRSERGYQGQLYCALQVALEQREILAGELILEMEYQKIAQVHHLTQRPDIILHIPREVSGAGPTENNACVWALKRAATIDRAKEDFDKLDLMFRDLRYPVGVFINISSQNHFLEHYTGAFPDRIIGISVEMQGKLLSVNTAVYLNGEFKKQAYQME